MLLDEYREFRAQRKAASEKKAQEDRLYQVLVNDPWDFRLIQKIAKEFDYHFTIKNRDGSELSFHKKGYSLPEPENKETW